MYELLTKEELEMMEYWRSMYADGYGAAASLEYILRHWEESKEKLFNIMGQKLIHEIPISYETPRNQIRQKMSDIYWTQSSQSLLTHLINLGIGLYGNCAAADEFASLFSIASMTDNVVDSLGSEGLEIPMPNGKNYLCKNGTKLMKVLNKLASAYNFEELLEPVRLKHSQALNQKKISGTMCISIHPLDFWTMSDNSNNWTSCMSWEDRGDFRQGTVEMMNSPMVVCAYVKNERNMKIDIHEWSNKLWRKLYIVNPDMIMGIKGYPYEHIEFDNIVFDFFRERIKDNAYLDPREVNVEGELVEFPEINAKLRLFFETGAMYNDCYETRLVAISHRFIDKEETITTHYSGESECVWCGDTTFNFYYDDCEYRLTCDDCYGCIECSYCGDQHNRNEMIEFEGQFYCPYCYDNNLFECSHCGTPIWRNDEYVWVYNGERAEEFILHTQLCDACYNELIESKLHRIKYNNYWGTSSRLALNIDEITEEECQKLFGRELFDLDDVINRTGYKLIL